MQTVRLFLALFLGSIALAGNLRAQGIQFFEGTWQEALDAAARQDKLLFVDAYATWCGPCKRMAKEVFTKKEAGDFFNRYFINVKLDMERGEGLVFREKFPVSAFPTLYFIGADGEVVHRVVGAQGLEALLKLGQFALNKADDSGDYAKRFEEGDRDPELVLRYVSALNKAGKPSLKVVNTYLATQPDLRAETNLRILFEGATEADSRVFDLLLAHRSAVEALYDRSRVESRIEAACTATLMKAIEFNVPDLHRLAVEVMKKQVPARHADFALDADLQFHRQSGELAAYLKACDNYGGARAKTDPAGVGQLALQLIQEHRSEKEAVRTATRLAETAAKQAATWEPYLSLAQVHKLAGDRKQALKAAEKAKQLAAGDPRMVQYIDSFIQEI
jgi:thiol-disulfide isomerase/thioredoxin